MAQTRWCAHLRPTARTIAESVTTSHTDMLRVRVVAVHVSLCSQMLASSLMRNAAPLLGALAMILNAQLSSLPAAAISNGHLARFCLCRGKSGQGCARAPRCAPRCAASCVPPLLLVLLDDSRVAGGAADPPRAIWRRAQEGHSGHYFSDSGEAECLY